jgi:hypothetical protein
MFLSIQFILAVGETELLGTEVSNWPIASESDDI